MILIDTSFDFISHHKRWADFIEDIVHDDGTKKTITAQLQATQIDLGAFIIKHQMLVDDPSMRFILIQKALANSIVHDSDGYLIGYATNKSKKKRLHRQVLLVHQ